MKVWVNIVGLFFVDFLLKMVEEVLLDQQSEASRKIFVLLSSARSTARPKANDVWQVNNSVQQNVQIPTRKTVHFAVWTPAFFVSNASHELF